MIYFILMAFIFSLNIFAVSMKNDSNDGVSVEENLCPICYESLNSTENYIATLPCSHSLCIKCWIHCITEAIEKCPICRSPHLAYLLSDLKNSTFFNKILHEKHYSIDRISHFFYTCAVFGNFNLCQHILNHYQIATDLKDDSGNGLIQLMLCSQKNIK